MELLEYLRMLDSITYHQYTQNKLNYSGFNRSCLRITLIR